MLVVRMLPEWEWPRIAETGCVVDYDWIPQVARLFVFVVEEGHAIVGILYLFVTLDGVLHIDGLWVAEPHRGRVAVLRGLWRAARWGALQLQPTDRRVSTDTASWMRPQARASVSLEAP